ncbi:MAG: hypothetical protein ABH869_07435 [Candidatus Omnitrophota bacterium]
MIEKIFRNLLSILLIPIVIGTAKAFYIFVSDVDISSGMFHLFERGVLTYLLVHVMVFKPIYLYVLGHEFVHVLATWMCGGQVLSFNVTPTGGNVVTSKTNFFIELSPYFVPIYTLVLGPVFLALRAFGTDISVIFSGFVFFIGVTLAFHFVMTYEALKMQQSDILKSGMLFSFILIFLGNLLIVMAVFCPFFENLSFTGFIKEASAGSFNNYMWIYDKALEFVNPVKV